MFLLVPALLGCPGQIPQSRKTVVCVCLSDETFYNNHRHRRFHTVYPPIVKILQEYTVIPLLFTLTSSPTSHELPSSFQDISHSLTFHVGGKPRHYYQICIMLTMVTEHAIQKLIMRGKKGNKVDMSSFTTFAPRNKLCFKA